VTTDERAFGVVQPPQLLVAGGCRRPVMRERRVEIERSDEAGEF